MTKTETGKKGKKEKKKDQKKKMKKFIVSGRFLMGDVLQEFQKEIEALGENRAREKTFQDLGSKHQVKRSRVIITTVEETK
jgi:ribosomal protein L20A (L18A)